MVIGFTFTQHQHCFLAGYKQRFFDPARLGNTDVGLEVVDSSSRGEEERRNIVGRAVTMTTTHHHHDVLSSSSSQEDEQQVPETTFEYYSDGILATAFLIIAILAAKR